MRRTGDFLTFSAFLVLLWLSASMAVRAQSLPDAAIREELIGAVLEEGEEQSDKIEALAESGSELVAAVLGLWRGGNLFFDTAGDGTKVLFVKEGAEAVRLDTGVKFTPVVPKEMETTSRTRKAIKKLGFARRGVPRSKAADRGSWQAGDDAEYRLFADAGGPTG